MSASSFRNSQQTIAATFAVAALVQLCMITDRLRVECSGPWAAPQTGSGPQGAKPAGYNDDPNYAGFKQFIRLATQPHQGAMNPLYRLAVAKQMEFNERERQKSLADNSIGPPTPSPVPVIDDEDAAVSSNLIPFEDLSSRAQSLDDDDAYGAHVARVLDRQSNDIRSAAEDGGGSGGGGVEIYLLEDKDYPESLYENYNGAGQVAGIAALPNNDVAILHRAGREWTRDTFDAHHTVAGGPQSAQDNLIKNDTIVVLDGDDGSAEIALGADLFYMPHGIAADGHGNLWVTDVARHQVMRLPTGGLLRRVAVAAKADKIEHRRPHDGRGSNYLRAMMKRSMKDRAPPALAPAPHLQPDVIIGEAFVPGQGAGHFCQPSEVAVSSDGRLVYVADGYCNKRVAVYTGAGKFVAHIGDDLDMDVVHSLALCEDQNMLHVADRERRRIFTFKAGLGSEPAETLGQLVNAVDYPIGRVFALTCIGPEHLLVSSNGDNSSRFDIAVLNPFKQEIKPIWTSSDLVVPHALAHTRDNYYAYAADLSKDSHKKVYKFDVIRRASG